MIIFIFLMTYNYRSESSYMSPMRDDEIEPLGQSETRRDTRTKSLISARRQQSETEKSDSDSSNYLFVYFNAKINLIKYQIICSNHYSNHLKRVKLKDPVLYNVLQF